jgi:hypothetical protein
MATWDLGHTDLKKTIGSASSAASKYRSSSPFRQ